MTVAAVVLVLLSFAGGCNLDEPDMSTAGYGEIRYQVGPLGTLLDALQNAGKSVDLALCYMPDDTIVTRLNSAAGKGVNVRLVVDSDYSSSVAGLATNVGFKTGNSSGNMNANFAVIDGTAYFFSTAALTNQLSTGISIDNEQLVTAVSNEFDQLYSKGKFGSDKFEQNAYLRFEVGNRVVELMFLPQNPVLKNMVAYTGQAKRSVRVAATWLRNETLVNLFQQVGSSGISNQFIVGNDDYPAVLTNSYLIGGSQNRIVSNTIPYNVIRVDEGSPWETMIFTTFPFDSDATLEESDGICLMISSPETGLLSQALDNDLATLPDVGGSNNTNVTNTAVIAVFNALRIGQNDKYYIEMARALKDFDLVGLVEVMSNSTENANPWLQTLGTGDGFEELRKALEALTGENWAVHCSAGAVGSVSYKEYYAYIYKEDKVTYLTNFGFYADGAGDFFRDPYAAQFRIGLMDFTFVLQHAIYGTWPTDPREEAAKLYNVFTNFQSKNGTDQDVIIGGDFNLAADDTGFDSLYGTPDDIYWVVPPSTKTTIGDSGFVNPYDNLFASRLYTTEVMMTGRGAHTSWVTDGVFGGYPEYTGNNYKFANDYISDHVPVYMTLNVSWDDD